MTAAIRVPREKPRKDEVLRIRVTSAQRSEMLAAAERDAMDLSAWARWKLLKAARQEAIGVPANAMAMEAERPNNAMSIPPTSYRPSFCESIRQAMSADPSRAFRARTLASLGIPFKVANTNLYRLRKRGQVIRVGWGLYQWRVDGPIAPTNKGQVATSVGAGPAASESAG